VRSPRGLGSAVSEDGRICRIFTDGGARPNPGKGGAGYTVAKGVYTTHKKLGCRRKQTDVCECCIDCTEHIGTRRSVHVGAHVTNNECEWAARYRAVTHAVSSGEKYLELYTDSQIVTEQLLNNYGICEPILGTYTTPARRRHCPELKPGAYSTCTVR
jgi:ribonuclease HI